MKGLTILGGGPAGMGAAFYAHRAGISFSLFEQSEEVGGMCRTLRYGRHRYDCGAHRFHDRDSEITRDLTELMGDGLVEVGAPSKVFDRGRFIDFPPTPMNMILSGGIGEAGRIGLDLLRARWHSPAACANFEDFAVSRFGRTLARRVLLNYSEKLWGLPSRQLSPDIATRRLQGMTLRSLFLELIRPARKTVHIDGSFMYPRKGYGEIVNAMVRTLPPQSICTGRKAARIECSDGSITRIHFADGHSIAPKGRILSTLPLTLLVKLLGDALADEARQAASMLRFRHLRLVFLRLKRPRLSANASIYIPESRFCVSRLHEPKNRSVCMAPEDETSVVVEVPCFSDDSVHRLSAEQLAHRVTDELEELRLIDRSEVIDWRHHFLANAYPVYTRTYADEVGIIRRALARIMNLDTLGRAGLFFYSHLHDQLRNGKDYVTRLMQSAQDVRAPQRSRFAAQAG